MREGRADDSAASGAEAADGAARFSRREAIELGAAAASLALLPAAAPAATGAGEAAAALPTTHSVTLTVNGAAYRAEIDPRLSLLDFLRERLDLAGAKKGCNQGACGACTVLVGGRRINACLALTAMLDGAEVTTIEGLAEGGELHPLQAAFIRHEGLQCGYCTPGQILSGVACIAEGHARSPEEIRYWMSGNICRCGAYPGIVAAVADAAGSAAR